MDEAGETEGGEARLVDISPSQPPASRSRQPAAAAAITFAVASPFRALFFTRAPCHETHLIPLSGFRLRFRVAVISAKNHKRQPRKRQSVTAKREKSQTPKVLTAISPYLT